MGFVCIFISLMRNENNGVAVVEPPVINLPPTPTNKEQEQATAKMGNLLK